MDNITPGHYKTRNGTTAVVVNAVDSDARGHLMCNPNNSVHWFNGRVVGVTGEHPHDLMERIAAPEPAAPSPPKRDTFNYELTIHAPSVSLTKTLLDAHYDGDENPNVTIVGSDATIDELKLDVSAGIVTVRIAGRLTV